MTIEAMKQALEALHFARLSIDEWSGYASDYFQNKYDLKGDIAEVEQAIASLRTAIEHAEMRSCNYPKCPYPCPDLPDCKDSEDLYDLAVKADNGGQP